jgi:uncharacterized membrane protein YdbT with pleckstrin-like domain
MLVDPNLISRFLCSVHLFGKLSEDQIAELTDAARSRLYSAGQVIYEIGSEATEFYVIYSGKVQIERSVEGENEYATQLVPEDYFGQESLVGADFRLTSASALEETIVLVFDGEYLMGIVRNNLTLKARFDLMLQSFHLLWDTSIAWREPGESVYYYARRHRFFLLLRLVLPFLLGLFALPVALAGQFLLPGMMTPFLLAGMIFVIAIIWGIWNYIDWTNDFYIITDRRVIYLEKILFLYDSRTESPLEAILSVSRSTTQIGRILGYGNIHIRSFTGIVPMFNIDQPQEVQAMLERLLQRAKIRQGQEEKRSIDRVIQNRLEPRPAGQSRTEPAPVSARPTEVKPGGLQTFLVNFLHLRFEQNGIITYRKHWFILLKQIWWPTLIELVLFVIFIARFLSFFEFISLESTSVVVFSVGFLILGWWGYQYIDWSNDIYIITQDQIIDVDKKPLGTESRKSAPIKNILSIEYERLGFTGYLLNFGTVNIKVGESTFTFDTVYNPSEVQRDLFKRYSEFKNREKQAQDEAEKRRLADWIEGYHRWQQHEPRGNVPPDGIPPGSFSG